MAKAKISKPKITKTFINNAAPFVKTLFSFIYKGPLIIFKTLCFWIGFLTLIFVIIISAVVIYFYASLPNLETLKYDDLKLKAKKTMTSTIGKNKNFKWTTIEEINKEFLYAIVMSEDTAFFEHGGLDYDAILFSIAKNLKEKKYVSGGSTISQQIVKNLFLSQEKTINRKLKEIAITLDLEKYFTKNQILEVYLNLVEFGPNIVGINAAAKHFFDKSPDKINAAEGAFIGLMLPSPRHNYFSIFQNQNISKINKSKLHRVLNDMLYHEYVTPKQFQTYIKYDYFKNPKKTEKK